MHHPRKKNRRTQVAETCFFRACEARKRDMNLLAPESCDFIEKMGMGGDDRAALVRENIAKAGHGRSGRGRRHDGIVG